MRQLPQILVIDDVLENIKVLASVLNGQYDVSFASSGAEALALVERTPPDLILLDLMMPVMDGFEVFKRLQENPLTCTIPVIFVTANGDFETETAVINAGATDFIHKPINPYVVRARVGHHLQMVSYRKHLEHLVDMRTRELAAERDLAEAANRAKSAFLVNMNHELRTPLNQILGMLTLALHRLDGDAAKPYVEKACQVSERYLELISNLLDVSALEAERISPQGVAFSPKAVLEQLLAEVRPRAEAKGLGLEGVFAGGIPGRVLGDPVLLSKVLRQLLDNAIKFSMSGDLRLRVMPGHVSGTGVTLDFAVSDEGVGMSPEVQAGLFRLFNQGDNSLTRAYGGTGIGLKLCQRLVSLLGGQIDYESREGEGTTFHFSLTFPLASAEAAEGASSAGTEEVSGSEALEACIERLQRLLASDDLQAIAVFEQCRGHLAGLLGVWQPGFVEALERLDFEGASHLLAIALADPGR